MLNRFQFCFDRREERVAAKVITNKVVVVVVVLKVAVVAKEVARKVNIENNYLFQKQEIMFYFRWWWKEVILAGKITTILIMHIWTNKELKQRLLFIFKLLFLHFDQMFAFLLLSCWHYFILRMNKINVVEQIATLDLTFWLFAKYIIKF